MSEKVYNAVYYERVSTTHTDQNESMENQRQLANSYLKRHPEIKLVEPIDRYSERISGKSDERPKYQEMLKRVRRGDIDYILIKDFKRLSRSVELSMQIRELAREFHFRFILLSTGQIYDPNAGENRMFYGFESLVNEEVVHRQSEYGRLAHRQKCEAKRLNRNNLTFGYAWNEETKDIVIDDDKAEIIRIVFNLYVFGNATISEIRNKISRLGYNYSAVTISKWLKETAFIGVFHINKKGSELQVGSGKHTKRFWNPEEEWVPVERPDLAIIEPEVFALAQRIRDRRRYTYQGQKTQKPLQSYFMGTHLFAGIVSCNECKSSYLFRFMGRTNKYGIYYDSYKTRSKYSGCECPNKDYQKIPEMDLKQIIVRTVNGILAERNQCFEIVMKAVEKVLKEFRTGGDILKRKNQELKSLETEAARIIDRFEHATGRLLETLNDKYNEIIIKIEILKKEIKCEDVLTDSEQIVKQRLLNIEKALDGWKQLDCEKLDRRTVLAFINKIIVHKDGDIEIYLNECSEIGQVLRAVKKDQIHQEDNKLPLSYSEHEPFIPEPKTLQFSLESMVGKRIVLREFPYKGCKSGNMINGHEYQVIVSIPYEFHR